MRVKREKEGTVNIREKGGVRSELLDFQPRSKNRKDQCFRTKIPSRELIFLTINVSMHWNCISLECEQEEGESGRPDYSCCRCCQVLADLGISPSPDFESWASKLVIAIYPSIRSTSSTSAHPFNHPLTTTPTFPLDTADKDITSMKMATDTAARAFFSQPYFAVVGASSDPTKFGHKSSSFYPLYTSHNHKISANLCFAM